MKIYDLAIVILVASFVYTVVKDVRENMKEPPPKMCTYQYPTEDGGFIIYKDICKGIPDGT